MRGTAQKGIDYTSSGTPGQVTIAAGQNSATVTLHAIANRGSRGKIAIMVLNAGPGYNLSKASKATVTLVN
jgi:hypothetical protein